MIHPKARIIAEAGPIVIGEGNLIEEQALIINGSVGPPGGLKNPGEVEFIFKKKKKAKLRAFVYTFGTMAWREATESQNYHMKGP